MLGSIFHKRKKPQDLRTPSLQDVKRFRDAYARHAERRSVEPPACLERSMYKAISSQRELHALDFRQEDITDPQLVALAETLVELPLISSLDLRDNRITDDGAKALLEVLRLQVIAAKTPVPFDPKTKKPLFPHVPEYTKYVTSVNLRGNEVSAEVQQELAQYTAILRREDKRLEIRAALAQVDRDSRGSIDEDEFKGVLKLLTGAEPSKRDLRAMMQQHSMASDSAQGALSLENVLLARCSSPTSNKAASPPWEALVQVRHASLGESSQPNTTTLDYAGKQATDSVGGATLSAHSETSMPPSPTNARMPSPVASIRSIDRFEMDKSGQDSSDVPSASPQSLPLNARDEDASKSTNSLPIPAIPPLVFAPPSPDKRRGNMSSARSSPVAPEDDAMPSSGRGSLKKQLSGGQPHGSLRNDLMLTPSASSASSPRQSEPLDSPRSTVSVHPTPVGAKRPVLDDSDKLSQSSPDMKALAIVESPPFESDGGFEDVLGDPVDLKLFGNDSSTDDMLLSVLSQGSASDSRKSEATSSSTGQVTSVVPRSVLEQQGFEVGRKSSFDKPTATMNHSDGREDTEKSVYRENEQVQSNGNAMNEWQSDEISHDTSDWLGEEIGENCPTTGQTPASGLDTATTAVETKSEASDEEEEERVDIVDAEIVKDGRARIVMRLAHTALKSGLKLTDFPSELPFRNLLVLILSDNKLRDLTLFEKCRFPCVIALDISRNRLTKVPVNALAMFPKLQVLDMAHNQLKIISGVLETFKLRALNVGHNCIRSVTNIEHLVFLEVLALPANNVTTAQSLRLLSLNNMLSCIDLDGNPLVSTDERQRRKAIAYILNLVPTLTSLGSIACVSLQSKEKKKKTATAAGTSLFDATYFPEMEAAWIKRTCDSLGCVQDKPLEAPRDRYHDEDDNGDGGEDAESANNLKKPLNRAQQRQKDEMRSRAVAYRSREKAPPSPPKAKTSAYSFGPPLPPPSPRKAKKSTSAPIDPAAARKQLRRSSELSAPKHPPVDTALLKQEKQRKSRSAFDPNMSVAERILLAQEQAQRRSSSIVLKRSNSSKLQGKRDLTTKAATGDLDATNNQKEPAHESTKPDSPLNFSPTKAVVAFRIEPLSSIRRHDVLEFRVESPRVAVPSSDKPQQAQTLGSPRGVAVPGPPSKEDNFLRSLAVSDFSTHAAEELSTALTALNVLLSMCEKELSDRNKLNGYRASLEALGILDEQESYTLFERTKAFGSHDHEAQCVDAFERLRLVKRCMRQMLEKLHDHEPGSGVIRAFCRSMRSVELRSVLSDYGEPSPDTRSQERSDQLQAKEATSQPQTSPSSVNSRLFDSSSRESSRPVPSSVEQPGQQVPEPVVDSDTSVGSGMRNRTCEDQRLEADIDLDFLEPSDLALETDAATSEFLVEDSGESQSDATTSAKSLEPTVTTTICKGNEVLQEAAVPFQASLLEATSAEQNGSMVSSSYPASFDITFDIQMESTTSEFDAGGADGCTRVDPLSHELENESGEGARSSTSDLLTEDEPFGRSTTDDDWLGGSAATETTDVDALESIFQAEGSKMNWDEGESHLDLTSETSIAGENAVGDDAAAFKEDDCSADHYRNEPDHEGDEVDHADGIVESGSYQEAGTFESSNSLVVNKDETQVEYQETDVDGGEDPQTEFEASDAAYEEPEVISNEAVEEDSTELVCEDQTADQELEAGEDADDEEAETFGDWEKGFDPNSNHYFWFNHATGESSWEPPEGWPFEVDEPFEAEGEIADDDDGEVVDQMEGDANELVNSNEVGAVVDDDEFAAAEGAEEAGSHEETASRASEFEASRVSEFEFDDSDLPSF